MDGSSIQGIDARLLAASALCPAQNGRRRVLVLTRPGPGHEDAKPDVFGPSFDYVDAPVVRAPLRPRTLDLAEAVEAGDGGAPSLMPLASPIVPLPLSPSLLELKSPPSLLSSSILPIIALEEAGALKPIRITTLAPNPPGLLLGPSPLKVTLAILEDLSMTFGERDIDLSLTGTVQVASYVGGPHSSKQPLSIGVELVDAASQVEGTETNIALLRPSAARAAAGPIPESSSPFSSMSSPAPSRMEFVASFPCTDSSATTLPLSLLRYKTKPNVRPLPIRLQPSKITIEGDLAHIVVQVTSNRNLHVPLCAMSLAIDVNLPGMELGKSVPDATPSVGVSWTPPLLQWILPPHEELPPGQSRMFRASLPIVNASPSFTPFDEIACVSSPSSSSVYFPSGTLFRAQSKAALTKCTVRLFHLDKNEAGEEPDAPPYEIQQEVRKRYRITARAEAR